MRQSRDLGIVLQSRSTFFLGSFQLSFLELTNILNADVFTEFGKHLSLGFVNDTLQGINAFLERIMCSLSMAKLRLLLSKLTIHVLNLLFDTVQAQFASTL
jgi:hypothetical protein